MFRCWEAFELIIDDLMEAAEAMADGSYWEDGSLPPVADQYEYSDPKEWG